MYGDSRLAIECACGLRNDLIKVFGKKANKRCIYAQSGTILTGRFSFCFIGGVDGYLEDAFLDFFVGNGPEGIE